MLCVSICVCRGCQGNIYANLIYRPDLPNILQILFYIFPWFHFSKVFADCLQNTSLIAFTDKVTKVTTHVQYEYHWSQITQTQRIYAGCAYGDEKCCAQPNNGVPNCYDAPSTASAFGNLAILTSVYLFLAWYLAQVFGASLGMNRKPWFIFLPEFWVQRHTHTHEESQQEACKLSAPLLSATRPLRLVPPAVPAASAAAASSAPAAPPNHPFLRATLC